MFKQGDVVKFGEGVPVRQYAGTIIRMLEDFRTIGDEVDIMEMKVGRAEVLETEVASLRDRPGGVGFHFTRRWQENLEKIGEGDIYVGQRVKISEGSQYYVADDDTNPIEVAGVVTKYYGAMPMSSHEYGVEWDNGTHNVYNKEDLVLYAEKAAPKKTRTTKKPSLKAQIDAAVKVLHGYEDNPTASYVIAYHGKLPEHRQSNTVCHNGLRTGNPGATVVVSCIKRGVDDHPWFYKWLIDESTWSSAFYRRYAWSKKNKCVAVRTDIAANFMFGALFATRVWENPNCMEFVKSFKSKLPISFLYAISKGVRRNGREFSIVKARGGHWPFEHSPSKEVVKNFVLGTPKTLSKTYSELGNAPFESVSQCFGESMNDYFWLFLAFNREESTKIRRTPFGDYRKFFNSNKKFLEFLTKQYEEVMK